MNEPYTPLHGRDEADSSRDMTRRNCMRAMGAGAAAVGGLSMVGSVGAQQTSGRMVFVYDDGYAEDYTKTFQIHRQNDAPACAAVPSAAIGRSDAFLTEGQLTEMTEAGWEVMSHAVSHDALGHVGVTQPVEPGDTKVYVDSTVMGRTPHPAEIYTGEKQVVRKITGKGEDSTGGYLTLESTVGKSFAADGTRVRFTEDVIRNVLETSKQSLEDRGFDVTNFVYPYGRYDERTESLVKEYYQAVANAHPGGYNPAIGLDPYDLRREYFHTETMTEEEIGAYMDEVASRDTLGLFGGHIRNPDLTGQRIQTAIRMAQERNLEIVTLREALQDLGVYEATPTSSTTPTATPANRQGRGTPGSNGTSTPSSSGGSFIDGLLHWLANLF